MIETGPGPAIGREIRTAVTVVAHSLAARYKDISYYRPRYFEILCDSLEPDLYAEIKRTICDELVAAVAPWLKRNPDPLETELLWEAFGRERVDLTSQFRDRSSAYKNFERIAGGSGLPEGVVNRARELYGDPSSVTPLILDIPTLNRNYKLSKNPLSAAEEIMALCLWKLGRTGETDLQNRLDLWRGWVLDMVYHQVDFHFIREGYSHERDIEDVVQDALVRVLQQLAVYQPRPSVRLEQWVFQTAFLSIRMSLRAVRRLEVAVPDSEVAQPKASMRDAGQEADKQTSEAVEYALTRLNQSGLAPDQAARFKMFARMLGPLAGAAPARDRTELAEQLAAMFPSITEAQVQTFLKKSGVPQGDSKRSSA